MVEFHFLWRMETSFVKPAGSLLLASNVLKKDCLGGWIG